MEEKGKATQDEKSNKTFSGRWTQFHDSAFRVRRGPVGMITGPASEIDERGGEQNRTYNFYFRMVKGRIKWGEYRIGGWKIPYFKSSCICLPQTKKAACYI